MIAISKNVRILFSVNFLSVIWSTNLISVSVMVLQTRDTMLFIIELNFSLTFFHDRNLTPQSITNVNNQRFYKRYKSNKYR